MKASFVWMSREIGSFAWRGHQRWCLHMNSLCLSSCIAHMLDYQDIHGLELSHSCNQTVVAQPETSKWRSNKISDWKMNKDSEMSTCLYVSPATLWNVVVSVFLHCAAAAGAGGPGAQRFPPSVRLREAEGAADPDGGPRLRRPDGDRGHGACHTAPGVPPELLNHISSHTFIQCYLPTPIFEHVLKRFKVPRVWTPSWTPSIFYLYYALSIFLV